MTQNDDFTEDFDAGLEGQQHGFDKQEYFSVVGFVNKILRDKQAERTPSENFNASDMGKCYLMRYWKRSGKKGEDLDDRTLRNFAVGNIFHDFFQKITSEHGLSILSEQKMEMKDKDGNILISGRVDDLIQTEGGKKILYDYKTVHSKKFHYLNGYYINKDGKRQHVSGERDKHYEKQVLLYYLMLKDEHPDLTDLRILYISKDDLCLKEMPVVITEKALAEVEKEIAEINGYWQRQEEPRAIPKEAWECKYCPYRNSCSQGEEMARAEVQKESKKQAFKL